MFIRALAAVAAIVLIVPSTALGAFPHVVEAGESLSSVAASDGLSVEALAAANGLSTEAPLIAGSTLLIPSQGSAEEGSETAASEASQSSEGEASHPGEGEAGTDDPDSDATSSTSSGEGGSYVVQPGDTLSAIAARAGTTVETLAARNGLDPNGTLLSGAALLLPGESAERSAATGEAEAGSPEATGGPPFPTEERVTPSEVGTIAAEHGVSPSLAEAVAEQESGFNNSVTSSADARGVMQIVPGTWNWINHNLAGPTPLNPASATSNVNGGVLLLQDLLKETGGDPGLAAAGYFQGLESVRRHGELPETEEYVSNVLALKERFGGE